MRELLEESWAFEIQAARPGRDADARQPSRPIRVSIASPDQVLERVGDWLVTSWIRGPGSRGGEHRYSLHAGTLNLRGQVFVDLLIRFDDYRSFNRIDYVFVRGPDRKLRGEPLASRVVFDRATRGVFPSDHFGVYAEISD